MSYSHQLSCCISLAILVDVVFTEGNEQGESIITFKFYYSILLTSLAGSSYLFQFWNFGGEFLERLGEKSEIWRRISRPVCRWEIKD
jgi:hypothetical protein